MCDIQGNYHCYEGSLKDYIFNGHQNVLKSNVLNFVYADLKGRLKIQKFT